MTRKENFDGLTIGGEPVSTQSDVTGKADSDGGGTAELTNYASIGTNKVQTGDSIAAEWDVIVFLDGDTSTAMNVNGEIASGTTHGGVLQSAFDAVNDIALTRATTADDVSTASMKIAPGVYDCSDVSQLNLIGQSADATIRVDGYGASLNCTVDNITETYSLQGLEVHDTPAGDPGYRFQGGQYANHRDLIAHNCGGDGFLLGGGVGGQVAWSLFSGCKATQNAGNGWFLDGTQDPSWVNSNVFNSCVGRGNGQMGFKTDGTVNYNTLINMQTEGNDGQYGIDINSNETVIIGGHSAQNMGGDGYSIHFGPDSRETTVFSPRLAPQGYVDDGGRNSWFGIMGTPLVEARWPESMYINTVTSEFDGMHYDMQPETSGGEVYTRITAGLTENWRIGIGGSLPDRMLSLRENSGGTYNAGVRFNNTGGASFYDSNGNRIAQLTSTGDLNITGTVNENQTL